MSVQGMKVKACNVEVDAAVFLVELYNRAPRAPVPQGFKSSLGIADARALLEAKRITREANNQDPRLCFSFPGSLYGRTLNVYADRGGVVHGMLYNQYAGPGKFEEAVRAAHERTVNGDPHGDVEAPGG